MEQVTPTPTARRRRDLAQEPKSRTWCRVQLNVSLVPPSPGKVISLERTAITYRVTVFGPRAVMFTLFAAYLASHPWAAWAVAWAKKFMGL